MTLGQTDRFRDRQTNRRREANPLTRSYDSRGPDVRIRGTALHVAERYLQLARDANTASNPVAAENYLQHDSDDFDGLPDRFASPGQQARQAFSNQTNGAAPVTPQPYAQRQRWVGRKV